MWMESRAGISLNVVRNATHQQNPFVLSYNGMVVRLPKDLLHLASNLEYRPNVIQELWSPFGTKTNARGKKSSYLDKAQLQEISGRF